jgi:hypothetical protein
MNRKTLACLGAGLALAGTGAGAATAALAGSPAPAAAPVAAGAHAAVRPLTDSPKPARHPRLVVHLAIVRERTGSGRASGPKVAVRPARSARSAPPIRTWLAIERVIAGRTWAASGADHGYAALPAADRLTPVGTTGPQEDMPITPARYDNAATIVRQALDKKMGVRAAVVAVATAMQESTLENIGYGDRDSVGLFQQRPSCGWGSTSQIMHPAYAADAFLTALHNYQHGDPAWAHQPLWQTAQGVQASGFPYAYARWEAQAAQIVHAVTGHLYGTHHMD